MCKGINAIEFGKRFYDNEHCYLYLVKQKWVEGCHCSRCSHETYYKGKTYYHRKCSACGYGEGVTANTVLHGMKMLKAFHVIFRLIAKKRGGPQ